MPIWAVILTSVGTIVVVNIQLFVVFRNLVTRGELDAAFNRLDAKIESINQRFDRHLENHSAGK